MAGADSNAAPAADRLPPGANCGLGMRVQRHAALEFAAGHAIFRATLRQNALRPMNPRTTVNRMIFMSNQKLQFCM